MTATAVHRNVSTSAGAVGRAIDAGLELIPALNRVSPCILEEAPGSSYIATVSRICSQSTPIWIDYTVLANSHNDIGIISGPVEAVERDEDGIGIAILWYV